MLRLTRELSKWSTRRNRFVHSSSSEKRTSVQLPEQADVVIIGGGSAGCNALYHLGKRRIKAVLLEKSKLISGTTWHTAGLIWSMRSLNDVEIELLKVTRAVLTSLEEETGVNPGFINNGGLYIAHNANRMAEYEMLATAAKAFDIKANLTSNKEAQNLYPLLNPEVFKGALYVPNDGGVDPAMLINALTKSAKNHGCKVIENCPVSKILTKKNAYDHKEVIGVETPHGVIKTNCILNASGAWSRNISKMAGLDIPLTPMKHAYVITEAIEGIKDVPNVRDPDISLYFRMIGGSIGIGGYEPNPIILPSAPENFSFSLYELDWNVFNTHMEAMIKLMPKLSTVGIKSTICGPESFTPDHKPIMGEDPRCTGLFYSCGYNSAGMMLGGGCGEQIATWMINGRPDKHMFGYDIRRFLPEQRTNPIWINERSHEAYAKNYDIAFPHDEPLSGRNLKTDPFHNLLLKDGAVMEERQGWERPGWFIDRVVNIPPYDYYGYYGSAKNVNNDYTDLLEKERTFNYPSHHHIIGEEALACRHNVAMFDMSYFGKFYLCGPEAQDAADYIFSANTNREFDRVVYTCTLNKFGGTEGDCTVTAIQSGSSGLVDPMFKGRAFYIVTGGMSAYHMWAHINTTIMSRGFNVSLHDATDQIGVLSIQGPKSKKIVQKLIDREISNETFPFSTSKLIRINDNVIRVFRISFVGELGFELHIPKHSCEIIYNTVKKIGEKYDLRLAGYRALYSLSSEKGYHLWGTDLRSNDNPIEANLGFVCRNKGYYLGKNSVERLRNNGVKRKLVTLHCQGTPPLWGIEAIYRNGEHIGYLRRGDYSYTFKQCIGHSYVKHPENHNVTNDYLLSGQYEIEIRGIKYPAQIYLINPFDPQNKRLLGLYDAK